MNVSDRIKELRKKLNLSQTAFGEKLGVTKSVIVNIELGRVEPKEIFIKLLCKTFDVNPFWITDGKGDIFLEPKENIIENLADIYELNQLETTIIKKFVSLNKADRKVILKFICSLNDNIKAINTL